MIELIDEQWNSVPDYELYYEVSNKGRIRSLPRKAKTANGERTVHGRVMKESVNTSGYSTIRLFKDGRGETVMIHRLVALVFISNPDNKPQVNHKDFNRRNNNADNLEWTTRQENITHAKDAGRHQKGETHHKAKLTTQEILEIVEVFNAGGATTYSLAKTYKVDQKLISSILNKKHRVKELEGVDVKKKDYVGNRKKLAELVKEGKSNEEVAGILKMSITQVAGLKSRLKKKNLL